MPYLLEDVSVRESPDGSLPLLSALVVLMDSGWPSNGSFKSARRTPYKRPYVSRKLLLHSKARRGADD